MRCLPEEDDPGHFRVFRPGPATHPSRWPKKNCNGGTLIGREKSGDSASKRTRGPHSRLIAIHSKLTQCPSITAMTTVWVEEWA